MAGVTEQVVLQWIAAVTILIIELQTTVLTVVALYVVVSVHGHNSDGLIRTLWWKYGKTTGCTLGGQHLVIISDTIDLVLRVHGERNPIQTFITDDAAETARVIGLP